MEQLQIGRKGIDDVRLIDPQESSWCMLDPIFGVQVDKAEVLKPAVAAGRNNGRLATATDKVVSFVGAMFGPKRPTLADHDAKANTAIAAAEVAADSDKLAAVVDGLMVAGHSQG